MGKSDIVASDDEEEFTAPRTKRLVRRSHHVDEDGDDLTTIVGIKEEALIIAHKPKMKFLRHLIDEEMEENTTHVVDDKSAPAEPSILDSMDLEGAEEGDEEDEDIVMSLDLQDAILEKWEEEIEELQTIISISPEEAVHQSLIVAEIEAKEDIEAHIQEIELTEKQKLKLLNFLTYTQVRGTEIYKVIQVLKEF